jgi:ABC-type nitrate/sulfonate/bicarbonate transport system substrate-binding protein
VTRQLFALVSLVFFTFAPEQVSAQLKKVRFAVGSISQAEVPFNLAKAKGFYREEGLDVDIILIRGALGVQALVGGSVDYSSSSGSVVAAGVRGLGVRLLMLLSSKPQFDLVSRPEIRSISQLKGKTIGISSRGGAVDLLTQLILTQNGVTPHKDATLIVIGSQEEMMIALKTGLISAALLTAPRHLMLYREGFTELAYAGDYMSTYPTGGIGATEEKLKKEPAEVFGFVRGSLKGLQYYKRNRAESIDFLSKHLNIKDPSLAAQTYDHSVGRLAATGFEGEPWMKGAIDFTKKSLSVTKEIPPSQVFDFSFVEKAAR